MSTTHKTITNITGGTTHHEWTLTDVTETSFSTVTITTFSFEVLNKLRNSDRTVFVNFTTDASGQFVAVIGEEHFTDEAAFSKRWPSPASLINRYFLEV